MKLKIQRIQREEKVLVAGCWVVARIKTVLKDQKQRAGDLILGLLAVAKHAVC